jgi:hypothetical protein
LVQSFGKGPSNGMAFPHPEARKNHDGKKDKTSSGGILWKFVKRTVDITENRNANDDVNRAKNPTLVYVYAHDQVSFDAEVIAAWRRLVRGHR